MGARGLSWVVGAPQRMCITHSDTNSNATISNGNTNTNCGHWPRRKRLFGQELSAAEEAELAAEDAAAERWITARTGGHSN